MEAQTARGLLHPQDLGQGRVATEAAGLTQRWTAISRECSQEGFTPEQGQPISDYSFYVFYLFLDAWTVAQQTSLLQEKERGV